MYHPIRFTPSQIKYILCLHRLSQDGQGVKNVELAGALGLSKPSVHNMLKSLSELGVVKQEFFGLAFFTEDGRVWARKYAFCYTYLENKLSEICGSGAVGESALCGLLADMPLEKFDGLYHGNAPKESL